MSFSKREQPEPESAPKPEYDAESGYSTATAWSDRLKDFNDEFIAYRPSAVRRSHQESDCSSGYSSASFRSNRSKEFEYDFNSQPPFTQSFGKIHEVLLQKQQEVTRQQELIRQREDLLRQREDVIHQQENIRQREDFLRQWEDSLRQQEAQQKTINAVGHEQHLKSGITHSSGSERSNLELKEKELKSVGERLAETKTTYENELQQMRSALRENENLKSDIKRLNDIRTYQEKEIQRIRCDLEDKEKQAKSANEKLAETKATYENELHQMRSALRENENLKSDIQRLNDIRTYQEKEIQRIRSALGEKEQQVKSASESSTLNQKEEKVKSLNQNLSDTEKNLIETKSALRNKEEEIKSMNKRLTEDKALHENDFYHMRSQLKQKEEEVKSLKQRLQESAQVRSSPQLCKPQGCEHKESMTQMDTFYKKKLNEARSAVAEKEKELKSVKDRLVRASLKTGNTESMNNPVSKTRLTEMYDNLKLLQWPKVKDQLKSRKMNPKEAKDLIQKTFGNASDEMKRRRQQIEEMFQQSESSSGPTQKVKEYRQLTVQNLQMTLFQTNKEELLKTGFPESLDEFPEEVKVDLRPLTSECYWLSCLMALNNPPLQPDWKNHVPGFDSWDIFPREIKPKVM